MSKDEVLKNQEKTANEVDANDSAKENDATNNTEKTFEELEKLEKQNAECQDKYARLYAEFENYKKRTRQERFDLIQTAGSDLIFDLLSVLDDFERSIDVLKTATDVDAVKEGSEIIYKKFLSILKQKGLEPINAMDTDFDTDFHEAVSMMENPEKKGKVVDVVQKGYLLRDKVLRFAKVVIGN